MSKFLASPAFASSGVLRLFSQKGELPIERLDPGSRATVLVGFAVLLLLLVFLLAFIVLAGRWARRYARDSPPPSGKQSSLPPADDWAKKPLFEQDANDEQEDSS